MERGTHWVVMNTTLLSTTLMEDASQSFQLDIGFEPFVLTPFWMKWHIVNYALPLTTLSLVTANTYV